MFEKQEKSKHGKYLVKCLKNLKEILNKTFVKHRKYLIKLFPKTKEIISKMIEIVWKIFETSVYYFVFGNWVMCSLFMNHLFANFSYTIYGNTQ